MSHKVYASVKIRLCSYIFVTAVALTPSISLGDEIQLDPDEGYLALVWDTLEPLRAIKLNEKGKLKSYSIDDKVRRGKNVTFSKLPSGVYCLSTFYAGSVKWEMTKKDGICFNVVPGVVNYGAHIYPRSFRPSKVAESSRDSVDLILDLHNPADFLSLMSNQESEIWKLYALPEDRYDEDVQRNRNTVFTVGKVLSSWELYEYAVKYFKAGVKLDDDRSSLALGDMYRYGQGLNTDMAEAIKRYIHAAELGNGRAAAYLCQAYDLGIGVQEDPESAVDWCQFAVETGDPLGQWYLSRLIARGRGGLEPDHGRITELEMLASQKASIIDLSRQGLGFRNAAGEYPDGAEALRISLLRMKEEDCGGYLDAGFYTAKGIGTESDWEKAEQLYLEAADCGEEYWAYTRLADAFWAGKDGFPRSTQKALSYYEACRYKIMVHCDNKLAWFLATVDDDIRNGDRAVTIMKKALKGEHKDKPAYVDTLAAAYAAHGDFDNAIDMQRHAISILQQRGSSENMIADYTLRLQKYLRNEAEIRSSP